MSKSKNGRSSIFYWIIGVIFFFLAVTIYLSRRIGEKTTNTKNVQSNKEIQRYTQTYSSTKSGIQWTNTSLWLISSINLESQDAGFVGDVFVAGINSQHEVELRFPSSLVILRNLNGRNGALQLIFDDQLSSLPGCETSDLLHVDFRGGDLRNIENPVHCSTYSSCCEICSSMIQCTHWTYTSAGECWLKGNKVQEIANDNFISGKLPPNRSGNSHQLKTGLVGSPAALCCSLVEESAGTTVTLPELQEIERSNLVQQSPNVLHSFAAIHGDWRDQWPIGNGKMGALVGGLLHSEVIPVSASRFFVRKHSAEAKDERSWQNGKLFEEIRRLFVEGFLDEADRRFSQLIAGELGMFQYILDLALIHSAAPLMPAATSGPPQKAGKGGKAQPVHKPPVLLLSRRDLVNHANKLFAHAQAPAPEAKATGAVHPVRPADTAGSFGDVLYQHSALDMQRGVARSQYLVRSKGAELLHLHDRTWFASAADEVVVGAVRCYNVNDPASGCLNSAVMLRRVMNGDLVFPVTIDVEPMLLSQAQSDVWIAAGSQSSPEVNAFRVTLTLSSSKHVTVPSVAGCGAIVCAGRNSAAFLLQEADSKEEAAVACNAAGDMFLLLSTVLEKGSARMDELQEVCWRRIEAALDLGFAALRQRHVEEFSGKMGGAEVVFDTTNDTATCAVGSYTEREGSFLHGCSLSGNDSSSSSSAGGQVWESTDVRLLTQIYQYGRYLMQASCTRDVPNLQGLWADGPYSAWNGDYHMNINMQMMYWGASASGFNHAHDALADFLARMTDAGELTARSMYGAPAGSWVAHGFTDGTLSAAMHGDTQWALCVTCGAWMTLQLWEHALHSTFNPAVARKTLLPLLRRNVRFFDSYLFSMEGQPDGDTLHTGPTSSPENAYEVQVLGPAGELLEVRVMHLALSPSIDISVLRQLSVAFSTLLQWIGDNDAEDEILAASFLSKVQRLVGGGWPVVDRERNIVLEYPAPLSGRFQKYTEIPAPLPKAPKKNSKNPQPPPPPQQQPPALVRQYINETVQRRFTVSEEMDRGHRHFSGMHWLFPSTYQPAPSSSLFKAAERTMELKHLDGGGHTSWSAAWEAILWARLFRREEVMVTLARFVKRYLTSNLLSLHPPLGKVGPEPCHTCFRESVSPPPPRMRPRNLFQSPVRRGMVTENDAKFQLDGNLGMMAAVHEMLVQSHLAGVVHLLPALPTALGEKGHAKDLLLRGDMRLSMRWHNGKVVDAQLRFLSLHPWLGEKRQLVIVSPNTLSLAVAGKCPFRAAEGNIEDRKRTAWNVGSGHPTSSLVVDIEPLWHHALSSCVLRICDASTACSAE